MMHVLFGSTQQVICIGMPAIVALSVDRPKTWCAFEAAFPATLYCASIRSVPEPSVPEAASAQANLSLLRARPFCPRWPSFVSKTTDMAHESCAKNGANGSERTLASSKAAKPMCWRPCCAGASCGPPHI